MGVTLAAESDTTVAGAGPHTEARLSWLPASQSQTADLDGAQPAAAAVEPAPQHELSVLATVAHELRGPLTALMELKGYRVGWARNGHKALDYLRRGNRPDLILLDLHLPYMDGWQFRGEQQRDPALALIPVVVVSGAKDVARSAADLGAVACLEKPVGFDELLEMVRQHS